MITVSNIWGRMFLFWLLAHWFEKTWFGVIIPWLKYFSNMFIVDHQNSLIKYITFKSLWSFFIFKNVIYKHVFMKCSIMPKYYRKTSNFKNISTMIIVNCLSLIQTCWIRLASLAWRYIYLKVPKKPLLKHFV